MSRKILYIHGFASSAHSHKATVLKNHFDEVFTPSLSHIPTLAIETLMEFIRALPTPPLLVGSSLGGYYALYLSQRFDLPAVLINPVVRIESPMVQVVGLNRHYFDGSQFEFTDTHLHSLEEYQCLEPRMEKLLLMVEMGDELIDHRLTLEILHGAQQIVTPGGNHAYSGFEEHIGEIKTFLKSIS